MDGLSGLVFSFLILNGLPMRTSADEQWSRPKADDPIAWRCGDGRLVQAGRVAVPTWSAKSDRAEDSRALDGITDLPAPVHSAGRRPRSRWLWGCPPLLRPGLRAASRILRRNGQVFFVSTTLRDDMHLEEDLPHELEHVMEQIEARNLARDSAAGRGAWPSGPDAYETERARLAGIRAANEVQDARRSGSRQPVLARAVLQPPTQ